jgi:hypothetical protein
MVVKGMLHILEGHRLQSDVVTDTGCKVIVPDETQHFFRFFQADSLRLAGSLLLANVDRQSFPARGVAETDKEDVARQKGHLLIGDDLLKYFEADRVIRERVVADVVFLGVC